MGAIIVTMNPAYKMHEIVSGALVLDEPYVPHVALIDYAVCRGV